MRMEVIGINIEWWLGRERKKNGRRNVPKVANAKRDGKCSILARGA